MLDKERFKSILSKYNVSAKKPQLNSLISILNSHHRLDAFEFIMRMIIRNEPMIVKVMDKSKDIVLVETILCYDESASHILSNAVLSVLAQRKDGNIHILEVELTSL